MIGDGRALAVDPQVLRRGGWGAVTPAVAGWRFISFAVQPFAPGEVLEIAGDGQERALIDLAGRFEARVNGTDIEFGGRRDVFDGFGHVLYLPRDTTVRITAFGAAELAVAAAPATRRHDVRLVTPAELGIETRGAGNASRQVSSPMPPGFPADRLHVVEVWTPGGNWSSFPPHRHEQDRAGEARLEETYYYRLRDPRRGWAIQRVYSPERRFELDAVVRDGDVCLLPWGYHTTVAAHGHDLYYLNVLAGPAPARTLQAAEDPELAPLRQAWERLAVDARVPFVPRYPIPDTDDPGDRAEEEPTWRTNADRS